MLVYKLLKKPLFLSIIVILSSLPHSTEGLDTLNVVMKGAVPSKNDDYLCTNYEIPRESKYIVKFEALADGSTAHHILLFGCTTPASNKKIWSCGSTCARGEKIIFAWAKNAPPTKLPEGVGMEVGGHTGIDNLVLQIHYAHKFKENAARDFSGIQLTMTKQRPKFEAGIFLLLAFNFAVPPKTKVYHADISCRYEPRSNMYPFAYRTHAHSLGVVISGYQYNDSIHEIGKGNPQWPQAFYPADSHVVVKHGDYLAGRCTYSSVNRSRTTQVGATSKDEMCNFYIMFYTDGNAQDVAQSCFGNNEPGIIDKLPDDSDKPLPPNPELDEIAAGHHHHYHGPESTITTKAIPAMSHTTTRPTPQESVHLKKGKVVNIPRPSVLSDDYPNNIDQFPSFLDVQQPRANNYYHQKRYDGYYGYPSDMYPEQGNHLMNYDDYDPSLLKQKLPMEELTEDVKSRNRNKVFEEMNQAISSSQKENPAYIDVQEGISLSDRRKNYQNAFVPDSSFKQQQVRPPVGTRVESSKGVEEKKSASPKKVQPEASTASVSQVSKKPVAISNENITIGFVSEWPAESEKLGQVGGVSTDKDGNVFVFHRGSRVWDQGSFDPSHVFQAQKTPIAEDTVIVFDKNGKVIRRFGKNLFFMPHGIEIDDGGNMWLTDVAMHQVFRYPPGAFKPDLTKGRKFIPGKDKDHFCKPSDVAILSTGEFFVSDGYCNGRIMKFDKTGKLIKEWGTISNRLESSKYPPTGTFSVVHSVTVAEKLGIICVADRENGRIQCFDLDGRFIQQMHPKEFAGRLFAIEFAPLYGGVLFAINGPQMIISNSQVQGFVINVQTGNIMSTFNTNEGLKNPHDIAVDVENHCVYIGELDPTRVWKFHLEGNVLDKSVTLSKKAEKKDAKDEVDDYMPSLIIGALLIIPVVLLLVITATVRLYQAGKLQCFSFGRRSSKQKFNLGNFLNPHKGFDALSTEESDHEVEPWDDSDQEEFSIIHSKNQKA